MTMASLHDEWVKKAEADYATVLSLRRRKKPLDDIVCFHCQQCAEKYFKAVLVYNSVNPPHTHDLPQLLVACLAYDSTLSSLLADARIVDSYSVLFRYPGHDATNAQALNAFEAMKRMRRVLRKSLGV